MNVDPKTPLTYLKTVGEVIGGAFTVLLVYLLSRKK
jgi:hypothetical protein